MFVNVGPAASNISESVDSLAYGDLVKNITNEKVSADADLEEQLRFLQVQRPCTKVKQRGLQAAISARPRSNDVSLWSANAGDAYETAQTGPRAFRFFFFLPVLHLRSSSSSLRSQIRRPRRLIMIIAHRSSRPKPLSFARGQPPDSRQTNGTRPRTFWRRRCNSTTRPNQYRIPMFETSF